MEGVRERSSEAETGILLSTDRNVGKKNRREKRDNPTQIQADMPKKGYTFLNLEKKQAK